MGSSSNHTGFQCTLLWGAMPEKKKKKKPKDTKDVGDDIDKEEELPSAPSDKKKKKVNEDKTVDLPKKEESPSKDEKVVEKVVETDINPPVLKKGDGRAPNANAANGVQKGKKGKKTNVDVEDDFEAALANFRADLGITEVVLEPTSKNKKKKGKANAETPSAPIKTNGEDPSMVMKTSDGVVEQKDTPEEEQHADVVTQIDERKIQETEEKSDAGAVDVKEEVDEDGKEEVNA